MARRFDGRWWRWWRWVAGEDVAVRSGHLDRGIGQQLEVPLRMVGEVVMMAPAQQHKIRLVRAAAVLPRDDVVGFAPRHRAVAAGEPAATVAHGKRGEQVVRHRAGRPARIEDDRTTVGHDAMDTRVA